ncbi:MAG: CDP-diacylglycerol--serine O-phosphatidyltransferase [bacterium]|nr:CDP-diacylglycerol--serine O-phosphatidyltransferase [bacterium]
MRNWLANFLTAGNVLCGLCSILLGTSGRLELAAWLIILAAVLDAFDGKAARYFGGGSQFGIYFDSLADVISFGVAPAVLAYTAGLHRLGSLGFALAFVVVLLALIRLARFTAAATSAAHDFIGLSSPLHGCLVSSYVIMNLSLWGEIVDLPLFVLLLLVTCFLMVSRLPMPGLPRFTLREQGYNLLKLVFLMVAFSFMAVNPAQNAFLAFAVLVIAGFLAGGLRAVRERATRTTNHEQTQAEAPTVYRGES